MYLETEIGGKAYNLDILTKAGLNVPAWFVFSVDEEITEEKIFLKLKEHKMSGKLFAVRSSAVGEDGTGASYAGQFESFLNVSANEVFKKVQAVIESANSERVQFYRKQNNLMHTKVAVIVQEMVKPEVSGVAFSVNPVTGNRNQMLISAVCGLCEGLVSGELNSDNYTFENDAITKETADKPVLSDEQVRQIAGQVKKITKHYIKPQDIEWAIADGTLYILQARPITTLHMLTDKTQQEVIWDNSNIIESYSGITTPLTFSFIKDVYTEVYKQFLLIMGVEQELVEENSDAFQMLGLIEGRVYYNLLSWYRLLKLLPGYEINAGFMESMMGVKQKLDKIPSVVESKKNKYLRLANLLKTLILNLFRLPKNIDKFYARINQALLPYENTDLTKYSAHELIGIYHELERKLLKKWQAPLVNDFYAMIFYGLLKKMLLPINKDGALQNDLLTGESGIISTEPIIKIREISNKICKGENADKDIEKFIQKFGNRCIGELKLETITYKQDPSPLWHIINSYVKQGRQDLEKDRERELEIRRNAEKTVSAKFKGLKKLLFKFVLRNARRKVKNRENLRFERTRLFGLMREIFLALDEKFYSEGVVENLRDIFYLTKNEIFDYVLGTSANTDIKALIVRRKIEFKGFENKHPADRFSTYGMVYRANSYTAPPVSTENGEGIKGIGCCAGIVRAKVKVVKDVSQFQGLEGCIMAAERTDPGWVPLFPISKGILVERGSILSHSAIVAREMGIPAIVGINNLFNLIKDGDEVEMDGSTGIVRIINE
ncbi:MAG: PEP-utilizing enzyme [Endomicrobia bacterium]|nr:PEP-utilizing enzyme [Endomicrobiia bacterium]MCL2145364.1 PEP-utilizing enzyme [Endomicrobiia bacterium]